MKKRKYHREMYSFLSNCSGLSYQNNAPGFDQQKSLRPGWNWRSTELRVATRKTLDYFLALSFNVYTAYTKYLCVSTALSDFKSTNINTQYLFITMFLAFHNPPTHQVCVGGPLERSHTALHWPHCSSTFQLLFTTDSNQPRWSVWVFC